MSVKGRIKRSRPRLWWKQWIRMSKMRMSPSVQAAQDAAIVDCTSQFDFGIRHRIQSKYPRVLCDSTSSGRFDMSIPVAGNLKLSEIKNFRANEANKQGYTFFGVESNERYNKVYKRLVKSLSPGARNSDIVNRKPDLITCQVTGKHAKNWGAVFMLNMKGAQLANTVAHGLTLTSTPETRIVELKRNSQSPLFPTNSTWHQCVLDVHRMPFKGKLLDLFNRLKRLGFINYFGMQQQHFELVPPILQAAAMLSRDFKRCTELFALNAALGGSRANDIHNAWKRGRSAMDDHSFYRLCTSERVHYLYYTLAKSIGEKPNWKACALSRPVDYCSIGLTMMQEMVFNYMTSVRIAAGFQVLLGDLVRSTSDTIEHVTEDNIHQYTIYDVVLPVLKFPYNRSFVKFPKNHVDESVVAEVLGDYGINLNALLKDKQLHEHWVRSMGSSKVEEGYRNIVVRPIKLSYALTDSNLSEVAEFGNWKDTIGVQAAVLPKMKRLVVKALLPSESCMSSMMREVAMSRFGSGTPKMWQVMNLRPGTQVTPDTSEEGELSLEKIDALLKEFADADPELKELLESQEAELTDASTA
eukprot:TRINITY_DN21353_c0_g1_i1.p1 TRINITY_DN21353_c0_g1~~TRINITY_DN21353_c0_g1_i1.p1  ORF type:complete len:598 (+),score=74.26 TRINITY_DN21353_c0_g1_i1:47-1795(+)